MWWEQEPFLALSEPWHCSNLFRELLPDLDSLLTNLHWSVLMEDSSRTLYRSLFSPPTLCPCKLCPHKLHQCISLLSPSLCRRQKPLQGANQGKHWAYAYISHFSGLNVSSLPWYHIYCSVFCSCFRKEGKSGPCYLDVHWKQKFHLILPLLLNDVFQWASFKFSVSPFYWHFFHHAKDSEEYNSK